MLATLSMTSCSDFLDEHTPQATLSDEQVKEANHVDELVTSAYAIFISAEDINSSFQCGIMMSAVMMSIKGGKWNKVMEMCSINLK